MQKNEDKRKSRKKRRAPGMGAGLVSIVTILALLCGGALGYIWGANDPSGEQALADARARIEELEFEILVMLSDTSGDAPDYAPDFGEDGNAELSGAVIADTEAADIVVVAEFTGGTVLSDEAEAEYARRVSSFALGGADMRGYSRTAIYSSVLEDLVGEKVAYLKAQELGFTDISAADEADIVAKAQEMFDQQVDFYVDFVSANNAGDERARAETAAFLEQNEGVTPETIAAELRRSLWEEKLFKHITDSVTVIGADITAAYQEQEQAQEQLFNADYTEFEQALAGGDLILYYPEGLRLMKRMFFALDVDSASRLSEIDAELETLDSAADADKIAALTAEREALFETCEKRAAEALKKLDAGGDFESIAEEYANTDAYSESGVYVSEKSTVWSDEFIEACMAISTQGEHSPVVRTGDGVSIILYASEVQPGAVPLNTVNAEMTESTRESAKFEAYELALQGWISEANPTYYPERIIQ